MVVWAAWPKKEAFNQRLIRFWYGFDHPEIEGFEDARKLAQHAFTLPDRQRRGADALSLRQGSKRPTFLRA